MSYQAAPKHEMYTEIESRKYPYNKRFVFIGWGYLPFEKPVKETDSFYYYDTPDGREKYRKRSN